MKMAHTVDLPLKKIFSSTKVTMSHNKVPIHQFLIFSGFKVEALFSVFIKKLKSALCCRIVRIHLEEIED